MYILSNISYSSYFIICYHNYKLWTIQNSLTILPEFSLIEDNTPSPLPLPFQHTKVHKSHFLIKLLSCTLWSLIRYDLCDKKGGTVTWGGLGGLPCNWLAAGLSSGHMTDVDKCFKRVDVYFTTPRKPCF